MNEEANKKSSFNLKQFLIWTIALVLGLLLGFLNISWVDQIMNFLATAFTRLFQFIAVPTIALAVITTLATLGARKNTGKIFLHTIKYTLLTTFAATLVGAILFILIAPENLSQDMVQQGMQKVSQSTPALSYTEHILSVIPNNVVQPFVSGNVMGILLIAAAIGLSIAIIPSTENTEALRKTLFGLQEIFFALIRGLVWILPIGIMAFADQLAAQIMTSGNTVGSLGKYVSVVIGGNLIQFFLILPLFLLCRGINPLKCFRAILPAILMALFTKSSAATLPVNIACAERNLKARPAVARFILPICCTINMNGCAAFILVTSLFLLQNGGASMTLPMIFCWMLISVLAAIGNAGVPMGCYFLTLSLMSGCGAPIGIMGVILPVYAMIDMIETAVNISSDACICAIVDKQLTEDEIKNQKAEA